MFYSIYEWIRQQAQPILFMYKFIYDKNSYPVFSNFLFYIHMENSQYYSFIDLFNIMQSWYIENYYDNWVKSFVSFETSFLALSEYVKMYGPVAIISQSCKWCSGY